MMPNYGVAVGVVTAVIVAPAGGSNSDAGGDDE